MDNVSLKVEFFDNGTAHIVAKENDAVVYDNVVGIVTNTSEALRVIRTPGALLTGRWK